MWLKVDNLNTKLMRSTPSERTWLSGYLSFENEKARYRYSGVSNDFKLFNLLSDTFPTGLLGLVQKGARAAGVQVELEDTRLTPVVTDTNADLSWLRDYQVTVVEAAERAERGMLWCPTGSGKTEVWVALTRRLPCRWLFLMHTKDLMHQSAERFNKRTGLRAGRIGDGIWDEGNCTVIVATFQTLSAGLARKDPKVVKLLHDTQALAIDEAHVTPADSFWRVAMSTPNAFYRFGFSATPLARGDKRSVFAMAALGPVVYRIHPSLLIERGILAKPKIRMVTLHQDSDKPTWQGVYGECIVRSAARNAMLAKIAAKAARPCLVFVKDISHGKDLSKRLVKMGLRTDFVYGSASSSAKRQGAIKQLVRGDLDVLVCSVIFQEGIDIPSLASVVVASGGRSAIAALQRIGRGMRTDDGKKSEFEVWDVMDDGHKWLKSQARARMRAYSAEGYETIVEGALVP